MSFRNVGGFTKRGGVWRLLDRTNQNGRGSEDTRKAQQRSLEQFLADRAERMSAEDRVLAKVIGRQLRYLRLANKLTLEEVGKATGIHFTSLAGYERGQRLPPPTRLKILADYYNVPMDLLFGREARKADPALLEKLPLEIREWLAENNAVLYVTVAHEARDLPIESLRSVIRGLRAAMEAQKAEKSPPAEKP